MARLGWEGRCSVDRCPENAASCLRHRLAAGVLGFGGEGTWRSYPTHHIFRGPAQQSTPLASRTPRGLCGGGTSVSSDTPALRELRVWRLLLVDAAPSSLGTWPLPYCCPPPTASRLSGASSFPTVYHRFSGSPRKWGGGCDLTQK